MTRYLDSGVTIVESRLPGLKNLLPYVCETISVGFQNYCEKLHGALSMTSTAVVSPVCAAAFSTAKRVTESMGHQVLFQSPGMMLVLLEGYYQKKRDLSSVCRAV